MFPGVKSNLALFYHFSCHEGALVWDLPWHNWEPLSGTRQWFHNLPPALQETPEQVSNLSEYHWSLGCMGQGRGDRGRIKGCTPKRQVEASRISQQSPARPGRVSMREELQAGLKLSVTWGSQTLETNGIDLLIVPGLLPLSQMCWDPGSQ